MLFVLITGFNCPREYPLMTLISQHTRKKRSIPFRRFNSIRAQSCSPLTLIMDKREDQTSERLRARVIRTILVLVRCADTLPSATALVACDKDFSRAAPGTAFIKSMDQNSSER
jgi:hypothetical protein